MLIYAAVAAAALRDELLRLARRLSWKPAGQVVLFLLASWLVTQQGGLQQKYEAFLPEYNSIREIRRSFARLCPRMTKGSAVLIVRDPLNGSCSTTFLVRLMYGDYHAVVDQGFRYEHPITRADAVRYKFVFDCEGGKLARLDPAAYAASLPLSGRLRSGCGQGCAEWCD